MTVLPNNNLCKYIEECGGNYILEEVLSLGIASYNNIELEISLFCILICIFKCPIKVF